MNGFISAAYDGSMRLTNLQYSSDLANPSSYVYKILENNIVSKVGTKYWKTSLKDKYEILKNNKVSEIGKKAYHFSKQVEIDIEF